MPQLRRAGEQQDGQHRLHDAADDVGDEHDHLSRQTVGPNSSGKDEEDDRQCLGRDDDAERRRAPIERLDDGERDCDRHEPVAERRGRLPEPEQPELPLLERPEELTRAHLVTLRERFRVTCP